MGRAPAGLLVGGEQQAERRAGGRGGVGRRARGCVDEQLCVVGRDEPPPRPAREPQERPAVARDVDDLVLRAVGVIDAEEEERLSGRWLGGLERLGKGEQALERRGRQGCAPIRSADNRRRAVGGEGRAGRNRKRGADQRQGYCRWAHSPPPLAAV